jgi:hypothetical protein
MVSKGLMISIMAVLAILFCCNAWAVQQTESLDVKLSMAEKQWGQYLRVTLRYRGEQQLEQIGLNAWRTIAFISIQDEYRENGAQVMTLRLYPRAQGTFTLPQLSLGKAKSQPLSIEISAPVVEQSALQLHRVVSNQHVWQRQAILIQTQITTSDYSAHIKVDDVSDPRFISRKLPPVTARTRDGSYILKTGWVIYPLQPGKIELELPPVRYQLSGSDRRRFHLPVLKLEVEALPTYLPPTLPVGQLEVSSSIMHKDNGQPYWQIELHSDGLIQYGIPQLDTQLAQISNTDIAAITYESTENITEDNYSDLGIYHSPMPSWMLPAGKPVPIQLRYFSTQTGKLETISHNLTRHWIMPGWSWGMLYVVFAVAALYAGYITYQLILRLQRRRAVLKAIMRADSPSSVRKILLEHFNCVTLSEWSQQHHEKVMIAKLINEACFSGDKSIKLPDLKSMLMLLSFES